MADNLREELIESETGRTDLLKWKLLLVAALGSAGLASVISDGLTESLYVLAMIPLGCAYVDLLCYHLLIRNTVIGSFQMYFRAPSGTTELEKQTDTHAKYEKFVDFVTNGIDKCDTCDACFRKHARTFDYLSTQHDNSDFDQWFAIKGLINDVSAALNGECCHAANKCVLLQNRDLLARVGPAIDRMMQSASHNQREMEEHRERWGEFLKTILNDEVTEDEPCRRKVDAFKFENLILQYSSSTLCAVLFILGLIFIAIGSVHTHKLHTVDELVYIGISISLSSLISAVCSLLVASKCRELIAQVRYWAKRIVPGYNDYQRKPESDTGDPRREEEAA